MACHTSLCGMDATVQYMYIEYSQAIKNNFLFFIIFVLTLSKNVLVLIM